MRTVGDKATAEVIRNYIHYHQEHEKTLEQLELFLGMVDWILKDVTKFVGDVESAGDITIFVIRCNE